MVTTFARYDLSGRVCPDARHDPSAPPQPAAVPRSKIAVIFSEAFQDAKEGISRFIATINKLNAEFQPIQNELNQTAQRLKALQEEVQEDAAEARLPRLHSRFRRRSISLIRRRRLTTAKVKTRSLNYKASRELLLMPLQEDVGKALDAFGKANGITLILDGTQVPLVYAPTPST